MALGVALLLCFAGCQATRGWNPFVELEDYQTIVVEDFEDGGIGIGSVMADQLASELIRRGDFERVLRERTGERAIVVSGQITDYDEGNVALRVKFGKGVGQARLSMDVMLTVAPTGDFVGEMQIRKTTQTFGPDARRTGRETASWLRLRVVEDIAERIVEQRVPPDGSVHSIDRTTRSTTASTASSSAGPIVSVER